ncbi:MAG TPA: hypothetical protein VGM30_10610 [Puia sp.]|jgi:hypothetical protein
MTRTYTKVTIRPYVEKNKFNMGLEKYNQALFDGAVHTIEMVALQEGDMVRYITGLNPFAPDVKMLPEEERVAKEQQIKETVIQAEKQLAGNIIRKDDEEWWNKVKKLKADNIPFWSSPDLKLELNNEPLYLEPGKNALDLLKYIAVKAGGYPEIARNLDDARSRAKAPKFYLDELEETASIKTEVSKLRNQAGGELQKLYEKNVNKLLYILKVIDANSPQYKKSTPIDILYENADKYINGETVDKDKRKTAKTFLEVSNLDMETLKLRAAVKDATFYRLVALKGDGMIYEMETGSAMGKNPTQVVEFLKNPLNEEILKRIMTKVEHYWRQ